MDIQSTIAEQKAQVTEFMQAMGQEPSVELQLQLVTEEAVELLEATSSLTQEATLANMEAFLKEAADLLYVMIGAVIAAEALLAAGKAIPVTPLTTKAADLVNITEYILADAGDAFLDDDMMVEAFNRVHASNMSKMGEDGKPIYDGSGKVTKGPNYRKPDLSDLAVTALDRLIPMDLAA